MGNDGGSIPTRRELVKEAAKALTTTQVKEVQNEQQEYAWSHDPLTRKPLARPVVSDSAGILYNKDSIIEFLLADEGDAEKVEKDKVMEGRVKGMKDVVEVQFEVLEGERDGVGEGVNGGGLGGGTGRREVWVCPITGRELGPGSKAVYLVPCGHAFAGSVVKEVSGETCLQCNQSYAENDVIPILPTAATDIARLSLRVKTLKEKGLTHALKKAPGSKKRKKGDKEANGHANGNTTSADNGAKSKDPSSEEDKKKDAKKEKEKSKNGSNVTSNGIKNASTASLTRKVLEEQDERNKRRKLDQNENVKSLFSKGSAKPSVANSADYMTRGFSIGKK